MNVSRILIVLFFMCVAWIATAMNMPTDDIKGKFEVTESETVAYDEVDEKEMELYVSPYVHSLCRDGSNKVLDFPVPERNNKVIPLESTRYAFRTGEYPYLLKELSGILIEGEDLDPLQVKVFASLTGDNWKWHHYGGNKTASGIYFDLEKRYPIYTDPFGNSFSEDIGFDEGLSQVSITNGFSKAPSHVTFFYKTENMVHLRTA